VAVAGLMSYISIIVWRYTISIIFYVRSVYRMAV
jgi:hypothetical protein